MPRRSQDLLSQDLPISKKIKKDHEGEEDEPYRSPYSVSELWPKMHFNLLKETLGYLDLRNSTKLRRYSSELSDQEVAVVFSVEYVNESLRTLILDIVFVLYV